MQNRFPYFKRQRSTMHPHRCRTVCKICFFLASSQTPLPETGNIHGPAHPAASPPRPSRQNPQAATPGKCVSLKSRRCLTSFIPAATPAGTILCSLPSRAAKPSSAGRSPHETGFCHPLLPCSAQTAEGENKISCMRVLFCFHSAQVLFRT